jgi:hypothetical protein
MIVTSGGHSVPCSCLITSSVPGLHFGLFESCSQLPKGPIVFVIIEVLIFHLQLSVHEQQSHVCPTQGLSGLVLPAGSFPIFLICFHFSFFTTLATSIYCC